MLYCDRINPQALVFLFPFVVLAATDQASATSRLLGSQGLHFLGVISYSIYMTHLILFVGFLAAFGSPDTWSMSIYASWLGLRLPSSAASILRSRCRRAMQYEAFGACGSLAQVRKVVSFNQIGLGHTA
ncbi:MULTISPECIES: hypothetical protein [unclassified Bradyrhizobium]|uniref:hypothetical protein n=1 Tax=unclassified Bradyrhizobium TaxID=2631580 RepID=UPI00247B25A8|nr:MULTISPECIES: hypothetical protein [unclassified Bradyrhizobium]WGS22322.1 hypothetical protein MTX22_12020 [Bradyrhizobium sp. ISRA463]WGS29296.1 hypothetical protein MTX19_09800 [Bradyrhizobium sp. ISRA464]